MNKEKFSALLLEKISDDDLENIGYKRTEERPNGEYLKYGDWYYSEIKTPVEVTPKVKQNKHLATCPECGENTVKTKGCAKMEYCTKTDCFYIKHL